MVLAGLKVLAYLVEKMVLRLVARIRRLPLDPPPRRSQRERDHLKAGVSSIWADYRALRRERPDVMRLPHLRLHLRRFRSVMADLPSYLRRKRAGHAEDLGPELFEGEFPDYYKLNFHYQTDGYFTEASALRYDHQIELLFVGMAHMVRKVSYSLLAPHLSPGAEVLEFGAGTGTSGDQFKLVFPEAKLSLLDLSPAYLAYAGKTYPGRFEQARAMAIEALEDVEAYDAIVACFTLHEIPCELWDEVFARVYRALRPGGALLLVDAQQEHNLGDLTSGLDHFEREFFEPHFAGYRKRSLEADLERAGFEQVSWRPVMLSKAVLAFRPPP